MSALHTPTAPEKRRADRELLVYAAAEAAHNLACRQRKSMHVREYRLKYNYKVIHTARADDDVTEQHRKWNRRKAQDCSTIRYPQDRWTPDTPSLGIFERWN